MIDFARGCSSMAEQRFPNCRCGFDSLRPLQPLRELSMRRSGLRVWNARSGTEPIAHPAQRTFAQACSETRPALHLPGKAMVQRHGAEADGLGSRPRIAFDLE